MRLRLDITGEFEQDLLRLMHRKGIAKPSDAIRFAVHEAAGGTPTLPNAFSKGE